MCARNAPYKKMHLHKITFSAFLKKNNKIKQQYTTVFLENNVAVFTTQNMQYLYLNFEWLITCFVKFQPGANNNNAFTSEKESAHNHFRNKRKKPFQYCISQNRRIEGMHFPFLIAWMMAYKPLQTIWGTPEKNCYT